MTQKNKNIVFYSLLTLLIIAIDQYSKNYFIQYFENSNLRNIEINGFIRILYVWNYGISFGLFSKYEDYSNIIFFIINVFICLWLINESIKSEATFLKFGYIIILSGALGNLIDRVYRGAVFDFISLHYYDKLYFAVFNFADMAISFGVFVLIMYNLLDNKHNN